MNQHSADSDEKGALLNSMDQSNLAPLWEVYEKLVINEPARTEPSVIWKWDEMLLLIEKSGELVHGQEAQHRVLIMKNPHLEGRPWAISKMVAGYQCVLPGERTSAHRHTPAATRIVLEGKGSGTFVDGKRFEMNEGDLLIAPNWTWHCHENDSARRAIWLDVVDLPLVGQFDAVFG